jgi:hypothetical protein
MFSSKEIKRIENDVDKSFKKVEIRIGSSYMNKNGDVVKIDRTSGILFKDKYGNSYNSSGDFVYNNSLDCNGMDLLYDVTNIIEIMLSKLNSPVVKEEREFIKELKDLPMEINNFTKEKFFKLESGRFFILPVEIGEEKLYIPLRKYNEWYSSIIFDSILFKTYEESIREIICEYIFKHYKILVNEDRFLGWHKDNLISKTEDNSERNKLYKDLYNEEVMVIDVPLDEFSINNILNGGCHEE